MGVTDGFLCSIVARKWNNDRQGLKYGRQLGVMPPPYINIIGWLPNMSTSVTCSNVPIIIKHRGNDGRLCMVPNLGQDSCYMVSNG